MTACGINDHQPGSPRQLHNRVNKPQQRLDEPRSPLKKRKGILPDGRDVCSVQHKYI